MREQIQKMIKSGSITIEESELAKIEAAQVLIIAKQANRDRVKLVRIDSKTAILVKANCKNAYKRYMAKQKKRQYAE